MENRNNESIMAIILLHIQIETYANVYSLIDALNLLRNEVADVMRQMKFPSCNSERSSSKNENYRSAVKRTSYNSKIRERAGFSP